MNNAISEVLARSTSIRDALDKLKNSTVLFKIRDKGIRGVKSYRRKYRLDLSDLKIHYVPNKSMKQGCTAPAGIIGFLYY